MAQNTDPVRITESGEPLNDTWSNYNRSHDWTGWELVDEDIDQRWRRVAVECARCHQARVVWYAISRASIRWGCPRVPLAYRLRLWWRGEQIPSWSVNSRPPWLAEVSS